MKRKNQFNKFAQYTTVGVQMLVTIIGGDYLGKYLDTKYGYTEAFYEKWVGLAAVFLAVVAVIWQIIKLSKPNE